LTRLFLQGWQYASGVDVNCQEHIYGSYTDIRATCLQRRGGRSAAKRSLGALGGLINGTDERRGCGGGGAAAAARRGHGRQLNNRAPCLRRIGRQNRFRKQEEK